METPRPIQRLPDVLINQIAAGEVIDRPASAVKELVENSLDAGATQVEIHIQEGGRTEIAVIDNGRGIPADELALAVERHSTSKLGRFEDLEDLGTYGFRGEALASLTSVAEVELKSRTPESKGASQLTVAFGKPASAPRPASGPQGTAVRVRNLFGELPARQKFLRAPATEFSHIAHVVRELALGAPQARFFLRHGNRLVSEYVAPTRKDRMREVLRPEWEAIEIKESLEDMELEAYLSPTSLVQKRGELSLFVNGRSVRNRGLISAVRNAYADTLGPHHDPSGVVYLDVRRDWIDANVHPQKLEVRCLKQERLYQWIRTVVRKAIAQSTSVREIVTSPLPVTPASPYSRIPDRPLEALEREEVREVAPRYVQPSLPLAPPEFAPRSPAPSSAPPTVAAAPEAAEALRYLGQARAAYLVCEDEAGVVIVDQHALHEKLVFEQLRQRHREGGLAVQNLLVPLVLRLDASLRTLAEEHQDSLVKLGFETESFGGGDLVLKTRPQLVPAERLETTFREVLLCFKDAGGAGEEILERVLHRTFATLACHSVVRAGQQMSPTEARALLAQIGHLEEGWTCPHGRPVLLRVSFPVIEKHFERV